MPVLGERFGALVGAVKEIAYDVYRHKMVTLRPGGESKGRALLSYTTAPFKTSPEDPLFRRHSNLWECSDIARTFLERGYTVDVMNYDDEMSRPKGDYSVFVDIHGNMERLGPSMPDGCLRIMHLTGSHWLFQNQAEYQRLHELRARRGVTLQPRRLQTPSFGLEHADCATLLGNDVTMSTWKFAGKPIYRIPVTSPITFKWDDSKDFRTARKRFVWLGSTGLVLKGLDLILEAFVQMPELHLTVCGPVKQEQDFAKAYHEELFRTPNIQCTDWVDVGGPTFERIVRESVGLVYPTASEGASVAVVTCLHAGLVPIVSGRTGIDIGDFGTVLGECSVESVKKAVRQISDLPSERLKATAKDAYDFARKNHSREAFSAAYRAAIDDIMRSGAGRGPQT